MFYSDIRMRKEGSGKWFWKKKSWIWLYIDKLKCNMSKCNLSNWKFGCNDCFPSASQPSRGVCLNGICLFVYIGNRLNLTNNIACYRIYIEFTSIFIQKQKKFADININIRVGLFVPAIASRVCPLLKRTTIHIQPIQKVPLNYINNVILW